ncbi:MAG: hypothetical protein OSA48_07880 [Akkermansiaceae bacterium]|nr:hypothetical protein [Akkermansiaceae bacterium]
MGWGLAAAFLMSSCGGVKCYLRDCQGPVASLETVEPWVGEEMQAVKITRGGCGVVAIRD